jgi:hypothetical protein
MLGIIDSLPKGTFVRMKISPVGWADWIKRGTVGRILYGHSLGNDRYAIKFKNTAYPLYVKRREFDVIAPAEQTALALIWEDHG